MGPFFENETVMEGKNELVFFFFSWKLATERELECLEVEGIPHV